MRQCAILSMDNLDNFEVYDDRLITPMHQAGWQLERISWRQPQVDWNRYEAVIIRSPWDYQQDADKFLRVLAEIEASKARLFNSLDVVKWNINKRYLQQLQQQGVIIVPSQFGDTLTEDILASAFDGFVTDQLVIKPTISANADNTFWLKRENFTHEISALLSIFKQQEYIIQPFVPAVIEEGEYSLFYFNGQYSHAILKTPKADDFRVQEEHGGQLTSISPEPALLAAAEKTLQHLPEIPLYARLDYVRFNQQFCLMEAELIEPSLYFNMDEQSPMRFTQAFVDVMKN
jgi:glutathione synthase/RimK-type ligase-like ATP-grasp enzyme